MLDTNGNGLIDKVSWNVPRLSEQKFKIKIVKAIDVAIGSKDSGGNVVSAVYDIYADGILAESSGSGVSKLLNLTKKNDIVITPSGKHIKKIVINEISGFSDITASIGIDDVPSAKDTTKKWDKMYAIDPAINFTSGSITATASGKSLFKCKDWDFASQSCLGEWKYIMDITPGEDYTVQIDPNDPDLESQT